MKSLSEKLLRADLSKDNDKNRPIGCRSAFKSAHSRPKAIWFYSLISNKLEYSKTATGHRDRLAFSDEPFSGSDEWIRGRVFEEDGKYYIFFYLDSSVDRNLLLRSIDDLYSQIQDNFEYQISDIVDDNSRSLTKSKKKRSI